MSKTLAKLLDKSEAEMTALIRKLEDLNGYPSEDVRLMAETFQHSRTKLAQLGLDPDDTTAEELYEALRGRFEADSAQIDKALAVSGSTSLEQRQEKALQMIRYCGPIPEVWTLKNNSAKKILQAEPPKKLMKQLNCRSIESFIKKIDYRSAYLTAPYMESVNWQKNFQKKLAQLDSADFEIRSIRVVVLPGQKWQTIKGPRSPVVVSPEIGAIALWPANLLPNTRVLTLSLYLLDGLHSLTNHDLSATLFHLHPSLSWWSDTAQLISNLNDQPVSFNIRDIATSHLKGHDFGQRSSRQGRKSLLRNLLSRYDRQPEQTPGLLTGNIPKWRTPVSQLAREYITVE